MFRKRMRRYSKDSSSSSQSKRYLSCQYQHQSSMQQQVCMGTIYNSSFYQNLQKTSRRQKQSNHNPGSTSSRYLFVDPQTKNDKSRKKTKKVQNSNYPKERQQTIHNQRQQSRNNSLFTSNPITHNISNNRNTTQLSINNSYCANRTIFSSQKQINNTDGIIQPNTRPSFLKNIFEHSKQVYYQQASAQKNPNLSINTHKNNSSSVIKSFMYQPQKNTPKPLFGEGFKSTLFSNQGNSPNMQQPNNLSNTSQNQNSNQPKHTFGEGFKSTLFSNQGNSPNMQQPNNLSNFTQIPNNIQPKPIFDGGKTTLYNNCQISTSLQRPHSSANLNQVSNNHIKNMSQSIFCDGVKSTLSNNQGGMQRPHSSTNLNQTSYANKFQQKNNQIPNFRANNNNQSSYRFVFRPQQNDISNFQQEQQTKRLPQVLLAQKQQQNKFQQQNFQQQYMDNCQSMNYFQNQPIQQLDLSYRSFNCLQNRQNDLFREPKIQLEPSKIRDITDGRESVQMIPRFVDQRNVIRWISDNVCCFKQKTEDQPFPEMYKYISYAHQRFFINLDLYFNSRAEWRALWDQGGYNNGLGLIFRLKNQLEQKIPDIRQIYEEIKLYHQGTCPSMQQIQYKFIYVEFYTTQFWILMEDLGRFRIDKMRSYSDFLFQKSKTYDPLKFNAFEYAYDTTKFLIRDFTTKCIQMLPAGYNTLQINQAARTFSKSLIKSFQYMDLMQFLRLKDPTSFINPQVYGESPQQKYLLFKVIQDAIQNRKIKLNPKKQQQEMSFKEFEERLLKSLL